MLWAAEFYEADESPSDANASDTALEAGETTNDASDTAADCSDCVSESVTDSNSAPATDGNALGDCSGSVQQCENTVTLDTENAAMAAVSDQNMASAYSMSQLDGSHTRSHLGTDDEANDMQCKSADEDVSGDTECPSQATYCNFLPSADADADTHSQQLDTDDSNNTDSNVQLMAKDDNSLQQLADDANDDGAGDLPDITDCNMQPAQDSNTLLEAAKDEDLSQLTGNQLQAREEALDGGFPQSSHGQLADGANQLQDIVDSNSVPADHNSTQLEAKDDDSFPQPSDGQPEIEEEDFDGIFSQPADSQPADSSGQEVDSCQEFSRSASEAAQLAEDEPSTADSYDDPADFVEASSSLNPELSAGDSQLVVDGEEMDQKQLEDDAEEDSKDDDEQFVDSASDIFLPQPTEGSVNI